MATIHDPNLPLAAELTRPESSRDLLQAAVGDEPVGPATIVETVHRPGRRCLVRYRTTVAGSDVELVAVTGDRLPDGGVRLVTGDDEVVVWRFPHDPELPGLAPLLEGHAAQDLLEQLGVPSAGLELSVASYRPERRAVVEARTPLHRLFCKVVRPHRAAALHDLHVSLADRAPTPRSIGWSEELGVVALEAVPGSPVAALLASGTARELPAADDLISLLDGIAASGITGRARPAPPARVRELGAVITAALPGLTEPLAEVAAAADALPDDPAMTAHRDFHASQILVHEGTLRLVDIDTVGMGTRADDLAMMLAQLVCLARPDSAHPEAILAYADALLTGFAEHSDPHRLAIRVGSAIVGFATGPLRTGESEWEAETRRRVELAHAWIRRGV